MRMEFERKAGAASPRKNQPSLAVERCQHNAAPANPVAAQRPTFDFDTHDHCGVFLDFTDLAEFDVIGESGNQRRLKVQGGKISGGEPRKEKEDSRPKRQRAHRDRGGSDPQGAMQPAGGWTAGIEMRRNCAFGAPVHFDADKGRDSKAEKEQQENNERRIYRQNCGGKDRGEGEKTEKKVIACRGGAIEAYADGEEQQMNCGE